MRIVLHGQLGSEVLCNGNLLHRHALGRPDKSVSGLILPVGLGRPLSESTSTTVLASEMYVMEWIVLKRLTLITNRNPFSIPPVVRIMADVSFASWWQVILKTTLTKLVPDKPIVRSNSLVWSEPLEQSLYFNNGTWMSLPSPDIANVSLTEPWFQRAACRSCWQLTSQVSNRNRLGKCHVHARTAD